MDPRPSEGQVWRQERTPREGDDALWEILEVYWEKSGWVRPKSEKRVMLKCVGTGERKSLKVDSLFRNYEHVDSENS